MAWTITARRRLAPLLLPGWLSLAVLPLAVDCVIRLILPSTQSAAPNFPAATSIALVLGVASVTVATTAILLIPQMSGGSYNCASTQEPHRRPKPSG